jgi:hypothetical protein
MRTAPWATLLRDVLLYVSDHIVADPKFKIPTSRQRTDGPSNIAVDQPGCRAVLTSDLLNGVAVGRRMKLFVIASLERAADAPSWPGVVQAVHVFAERLGQQVNTSFRRKYLTEKNN